jgi:hypothetical protein
MSKRKRLVSPWSLGSLPVTPVENKSGWESREQFYANEREKAERPIREQQEQITASLRQLQKLATEYWSQPVATLAKNLRSELSKDSGFFTPVVRDQFTIEEAQAAFDIWCDTEMQKTTGYSFATFDGGSRCVLYGVSQAHHGSDMSQPTSWAAAFARTLQLAIYQPGELSFDKSKAPKAVEAPAPQPKIEDIDNYSLESTAGRKAALAVVEELASSEAAEMCRLWLDQLKRDYDFTPTDAQIKHVVAWFNRNNKNWLRHEAYNECRRSLVSQFIFPEHMLTRDERQSREMEGVNLGALGYDQRIRLMNRVQRLADQTS